MDAQIQAAIDRARRPMRLTDDEAERLVDALCEGSRVAPTPGAMRAVAPGRQGGRVRAVRGRAEGVER